MSIVSENHGGPDAPEIGLRHRCGGCGESLIGRRIVATATGDYCLGCVRDITLGPTTLRNRLMALGESEPGPRD